jgi:Ni,Fe-hydrogenase I cytochrome b subunit
MNYIMAVWCHIVLAVPFYKMEAPVQGNDYELTNTHKDIYAGYTRFVKYSTGSVIALVVLMALFLL